MNDIVLDSELQLDDHSPPDKIPFRSKFLQIAIKKYESKYPYLVDKDFLKENMVKVNKSGNRIVGTVLCIFCAAKKKDKSITIQYNSKHDGLYYWNFSNLFKHLKNHTFTDDADINIDESQGNILNQKKVLSRDDILSRSDESQIFTNGEVLESVQVHSNENEIGVENYEEVDVIVIENSELNSSDETIMDGNNTSHSDDKWCISENCNESAHIDLDINSKKFSLFEQISSQNLILTETIYSNSEKIRVMNFLLNGKEANLDVIKIRGDGSCLFGSLAHQLFQHKVNSNNHKKATKTLRSDVVKYINNNLNDFLFVITGRILEEEEVRLGNVQTKWSSITKNDCFEFLNKCLIDDHFFGGTETIKAVTCMHKVNILSFNESGPVYFPMGFNINYHKTIFIAYRLKPNSSDVRNHYDSVAEVNSNVMFDVVKSVNKPSENVNDVDQSVMEIN